MSVVSRFTFVSASEISRLRNGPSDSAAVYGLFLRGADRVLEIARYFEHATELPLQIGEFGHVYTGRSGETATRIHRHLTGDAYASTFRRTLLVLEQVHGAVSRSGQDGWMAGDPERALSGWLAKNAVVGWLETDCPREVEASILAAEPSPLNIEGRRFAGYGAYLLGLRRKVFGTMQERRLRRPPMFSDART